MDMGPAIKKSPIECPILALENMHEQMTNMQEGLLNHKQELQRMKQQIAELELHKLKMLQLFKQLEMQFASFA